MAANTSSFTIEERLVMSVWVHERTKTRKTFSEIRKDFFVRFDKVAPTEKNLRIIARKTFATGSVFDAKRCGRPRKNVDLGDRLDESINRSPKKSTRKRSAELNVPRSSMQRVMKEHGYGCFRPGTVNELSDSDMDRRREACKLLLREFPTTTSRSNVLFTDECAIYLSSRSRNVYVWSKSNPHFFEEIVQHPPHVMIWAGVTSEFVVGPYFFPCGGVNGEKYLEMLEHWLIPELDKIGLTDKVVIQQDGAPAHYAISVRDFLSEHFSVWIGRSAPLSWPPRSPDLTTCDNWLWSFVKEHVSHIRMQNIAELKQTVLTAFSLITQQMLRKASKRTWRRMKICVKHEGAHTEKYDS
jgi:hypothetical protein